MERAEADDDRFEPPPTEAEAEAEFQGCELLARRINARLEAAGPEKDYEQIVAEEIDRLRRERGDEASGAYVDMQAALVRHVRELVAAREGGELELPAELNFGHPLVVGVNEFAIGVRRMIRASGLRPRRTSAEHPLEELESSLMLAGLRLAAALSGPEWPPPVRYCATAIAMLKRVGAMFEDAELAIECLHGLRGARRKLSLDEVAADVAAMRRATEQLIEELRERLRDQ